MSEAWATAVPKVSVQETNGLGRRQGRRGRALSSTLVGPGLCFRMNDGFPRGPALP